MCSQIEVGAVFDSFSSFEEAFKNWKLETKSPMKVGDSRKLVGVSESPYQYVVYVCKHYGKPRVRGNSVRPNQSYFPTNCPVKLRVMNQSGSSTYKITALECDHNHAVCEAYYKMYPSSRVLTEEEKTEVRPLLEMDVETKNIRDFIREKTGKLIENKDIHNINRVFKAEKNDNRTEAQILYDNIVEFKKSDQRRIFHIRIRR